MKELKNFALQMARVWAGVVFVVGTVAFLSLPAELGPMTTAQRAPLTHLT
jgi:hypothetical protein